MEAIEFSLKRKRLEHAKIVLKSHFIGIDQVIDKIIDGINSWYFFPEFQSRPLVINLWGMTGVGKSDLVRKLVGLLDLEKHFYAFDCGELGGKNSGLIRNILAPLSELNTVNPQVLFFDEFQLMRSISESGDELFNENSRAVWQLLDTGKLHLYLDWYLINEKLFMIHRDLEYQIKNGVKITSGIVSEEEEEFLRGKYPEKFQSLKKSEWEEFISKPQNRLALNPEEINQIFEMPRFRVKPKAELEAKIRTFDELELLDFLKHELDLYSKPSLLDLSNSLIFVAGNLDEVYQFSSFQSPDISPDYFYKKSLKITIQDVKKELLKRFRVEQIARLGNHHIIYPSLPTEAYYTIIRNELNRVSNWTYNQFGIELIFSDQIIEWVFREGVSPTQGVRPLKSSIRYTIEDQIPNILTDASLLPDEITKVMIDYKSGTLKVIFENGSKQVEVKTYKAIENITKLRNSKGDEQQALTAVHESGHVIVHLTLFKQLPDLVLSITAESESNGMTLFPSIEILNLDRMKKRVAVLLAGLEAERFVFGDEMISSGSYSDIEKSTSLVVGLLKESGFHGHAIQYSNSVVEAGNVYHEIAEIEEKAKEIIANAQICAKKTLIEEEHLLLKMSEILSEKPQLKQKEVEELVQKFGSENLRNSLVQEKLDYKDLLGKRIELLKERNSMTELKTDQLLS